MSKFLNLDEGSEEDEVQQEVKVEVKKAAKKDTKKKKKNEDDDDIDAILGIQNQPQPVEELDEEARLKAEKKKEKKLKQQEQKQAPQIQKQDAPAPKKETKKDTKKLNPLAQKALEIKQKKEEEERIRKELEDAFRLQEEERIRREEAEEQRLKDEAEAKRLKKEQDKQALIDSGQYKTKKQIAEEKRVAQLRAQFMPQQNPDEVIDRSNVVKRTKKPKPQQQQQIGTISEYVDQFEQCEKEREKEQPKVVQEVKSIEKVVEVQKAEPIAEQVEKVVEVKAEEEVVDNWEDLVEDEPAPIKQASTSSQEPVKQTQIQQDQDKAQKQHHHSLTKKEKELFDAYLPVGDLRSPICCILGHVDTGKTTLLDKIRNTNVQEGEAGGITQQIGATFFPAKKLQEELAKTSSFYKVDCNIPGYLIIDTPGHESFANLRTRGSSLCDLAILVIDLMHGLEKQTLESLELLKMRKTPFIIALNKIDRCVEWKKKAMGSSHLQLKAQNRNCRDDYDNRRKQVFTELAEKGFNVALFWENEDPKTYVSVVPTSGVTGEGIPDLLSVIVKYTSVYLKSKISVKQQFNCTVMEKKVLEGHGTTVDCLLVDGILKKDDKIVLAGFNGPIVTKVKAILTPHPMKEMRVKGEYISHDILHAAMGLKLSALGLEEAMAGSVLYQVNTQAEQDKACAQINSDMESVKQYIKLSPQGVGVAASTLGSLEALLQFLNSNEIPVSYVSVGPVSKDDVMKALKNVLLEDVKRRKQEYACVLVFDIKVLPDAVKYAEENQIKIFEADIIYNLFDKFMDHVAKIKEERKKKDTENLIFPVLLKPVKIINSKDPLILGVDVEQGILKIGTPICVYDQQKVKIGVVETIELNHNKLKEARAATGSVAIRLSGSNHLTAGRQLTLEDKFCSIINRRSIDLLKEHYREVLTLDDWQLVKDLKVFHQIP